MTAVARKILSEQIVEKIKDYILEHGLGPGDRLPTEQEFAELSGVSRTCVREATKALSFLGIIHSVSKQGVTVAHLDIKRAMEYMSFHFALNDYPKEQILRTRLTIELGSLPQSMKNIANDHDLFEKLHQISQEIVQSQTVDEFIRADQAFHQTLLEASKIEPLIAFNEILQVFFKRFRDEISQTQWQEGKKSHEKIIKVLKERNINTAKLLLRRHFGYYLALYEKS